MDGSDHPVPDGHRLGADLCGVPGGAVALRASHENNCERTSRGFFRSFPLSCGGHSPTQNPKDGIVLRERIQYNRIYCTKTERGGERNGCDRPHRRSAGGLQYFRGRPEGAAEKKWLRRLLRLWRGNLPKKQKTLSWYCAGRRHLVQLS